MVIIEFFDKVSIENICSALLCHPEKVIFVGSDRRRMDRDLNTYRKLLTSKGIKTELSSISVTRNNLQMIVEKLSEIVENTDDGCIFDLTGGDDLYLVAVGVIMGRYGDRIKCHRFNFLNDKLCDCDADGEALDVKSFDISIDDNVAIYGGEVEYDSEKECFTYPWQFTPDFLSDVESMWNICLKNPKLWNAQINTIGEIIDIFEMDEPLLVSFNQKDVQSELYERHIRYSLVPWILSELQKSGLINSLYIDENVSFRFKNEQVKKCLTVAGQILELYIAARLLSLKEEDGIPLYNDVKVGAVIRWGQDDYAYETPTINEIDIIAMKGAIPVFISCKNGYFDANELYKLNTVADRFGNKYAKKVLVATDIENLGSKSEYLLARMDDMNIRCIGNLEHVSDKELERALVSLWKN